MRSGGRAAGAGNEAAPELLNSGWTSPEARGPGSCLEFASALVAQVIPAPGAASGQPPHMSMKYYTKLRTTSFPVYRRPYPRHRRDAKWFFSAVTDDGGRDQLGHVRDQR